MIDVRKFYEQLRKNGISFFTGVPDSLLKDFCFFVNDNTGKESHVIAANEGNAVALATGHYLATGNPALVYMQNSGFGNAVNPLLSLADPEIYAIPMLLLIGWRGEPGVSDEPQHSKQGRVLTGMLNAMEIPFSHLSEVVENYQDVIDDACAHIREKKCPYAIVVSRGTFDKFASQRKSSNNYEMSRAEAIEIILRNLPEESIFVSTTGKISREVYDFRKKNSRDHSRDFLTVGSMGHCSQIAMGIAMNRDDKNVFVLDGDGAVIMHMGALAISGSSGLKNFKHVVLNNGAHESVGGQPTAAFQVDFTEIAKACGYKISDKVVSSNELGKALKLFEKIEGPAFLEIRISDKPEREPGRPDTSPIENKEAFMNALNSNKI